MPILRNPLFDLAVTKSKNLFNDAKSVPSLSFDSDHRLLLMKLKMSKPKPMKSQERERFMLENMKEEERLARYKNEITQGWLN